MGYVIIDHRGGQNQDGSKGTLVEYDTKSCKHCQKVIRVVLKGCTKHTATAYRCERCKAPICRDCAGIMEKVGQCPGPFIARVEAELRESRRRDDFLHKYRSCASG